MRLVQSQEELLDARAHLGERGIKLGLLDVEDAGSNDVSADATGAAELGLLGDVDVGNVLLNERVRWGRD